MAPGLYALEDEPAAIPKSLFNSTASKPIQQQSSSSTVLKQSSSYPLPSLWLPIPPPTMSYLDITNERQAVQQHLGSTGSTDRQDVHLEVHGHMELIKSKACE